MRLAYQISEQGGKDLLKNFPQYNKSTIYKHCKLPIVSEADCVDRRRNNMGRPKELSDRDCRLAVCNISEFRTIERSFTSRRLQVVSRLDHVSNRTFRRVINDAGYDYCRSRKKGPPRKTDVKKILEFCKKTLKWWLHRKLLEKLFQLLLGWHRIYTWTKSERSGNCPESSRMAKKLRRTILVSHRKG